MSHCGLAVNTWYDTDYIASYWVMQRRQSKTIVVFYALFESFFCLFVECSLLLLLLLILTNCIKTNAYLWVICHVCISCLDYHSLQMICWWANYAMNLYGLKVSKFKIVKIWAKLFLQFFSFLQLGIASCILGLIKIQKKPCNSFITLCM